MLETYEQCRLSSFVEHTSDCAAPDAAYNVEQAKIAIGSGGVFGKGPFDGTQTRLDLVPEQHTDFIFTAVGEELGFVGSGTLLALLGVIAWRIWRTAQMARDPLGTLVWSGSCRCFVFQVFENVGMTMGIMPVTGIPLPFMSYGGSSTLTAFIAVGLVGDVGPRGRVRYPRRQPWSTSGLVSSRTSPRCRSRRATSAASSAPRSRPAPHRVGWLLVYPDTYEVGLPNQGLQILYEILNERDDAVAERSYSPWTDLEEVLRRGHPPVLGRHPPQRATSSTSWRSTSPPSSSTRTC